MITNPFFPEIHGNFGFGCMRLPMKDGQVDKEEFSRMADDFIASGLNYFDTAHGYLGGLSETAIRDCVVKRYDRSKFLLTDKLTTVFFQKEEDIPVCRDERWNIKSEVIITKRIWREQGSAPSVLIIFEAVGGGGPGN